MEDMVRLGFLSGMIAACFFVILIKKLTRKDVSLKCQYDERQQLVRGRGFQYGFFGWIIFNAIFIVLDAGFGKQYMDTSMALFSGLVIGVIIYASYAIWHEGYFSLNTYPKRVMTVIAVTMALNIICSLHYIMEENILKDGMLTFFGGANLACAAAAFIIFIVLAVKWYFDQRKAE